MDQARASLIQCQNLKIPRAVPPCQGLSRPKIALQWSSKWRRLLRRVRNFRRKKTALSWKMVEHNMRINDSTKVPKVGTVGSECSTISYRAPCSGAEDTSSVSREEMGVALLFSPLSPSAEEAMAVWRTFPCRRSVAASPTRPPDAL